MIDSSRRHSSYPLHLTMSAVFTMLLVSFGIALIAFNYSRARSTAFIDAEKQLGRIAAHLGTSVAELYGPAQNLVDLASRMQLSTELSAGERRKEMRLLAEALRMRQEISSVSIGYEDGSFSLVRSLLGREEVRVTLQAPPEAQIALQTILRSEGGEVREELDFFDSGDQLVEHRQVDYSGFDPRERNWYRMAIQEEKQIAISPYVFFTTREIGVTVARKLANGDGVVGVDLCLADLSAGLAKHSVTPSSRLVLLGRTGRIVASSDPEFAPQVNDQSGTVELPLLSQLSDPVYHRLSEKFDGSFEDGKHELEVGGSTWWAWTTSLPIRAGGSIKLITLLPRDELLGDAIRTRNQSLLISLLMLVVTIFIALFVSRHISGSLRILATEAENIRELRFDTPITLHSRIQEVDNLAATMEGMKGSIQQFLAISHALSAEKSRDRLLEMILEEARSVCRADAGAVLLRTPDWQGLEVSILQNAAVDEFFGGKNHDKPPFDVVPIEAELEAIESRTLNQGSVIRVDNLNDDKLAGDTRSTLNIVNRHFDREGAPVRAILSVPLQTHEGEVIGVLQLVNARTAKGLLRPFTDETIPYIEALCSDAAVALDNRRLLKAHKDLLESFIHILAGAIDAKSPYTHGHCQRVPEIARLLAKAADEQAQGPFESFHLSEDEWYELHLASWLHDCGKVTTPEYVVDKATKLETLGNRIHEIRTRFEVLWRDAEIESLKSAQQGGAGPDISRRLHEKHNKLRDDFEFLARCNRGDDPLSDDDIARIEQISLQTWSRNFDDGLGLSHGEELLRGQRPAEGLPVIENLLTDKPEHIVPREEGQHPFGDQPHGFKMDVPQHLYNRGELYNLKIARGTLTEEERFKINEHIIQTLRMLKRLPFPRELMRVPQWAGTHHEKLDGTGYPCRLGNDDLSIPERIMAIADIFEALTAADRPYMIPKSLSKAIWIMRSMTTSGHLCPDAFALFLKSGVYRVYAEEHLKPEQIDEVDIDQVLG